MRLYHTELSIYEIGLSQALDLFSGQYNRRLECLCACLNATKAWVNIFLSILPAQYVGFPSSTYLDLIRCILGIYRLSTFEHPEWDRRLVQESVNVSLVLEKAEQNFLQVKEAAGLDICGSEDTDTFTLMASRTGIFKTWWDASAASTMGSPAIASGAETGDFPMEFLDGDWLRDILGPWNE